MTGHELPLSGASWSVFLGDASLCSGGGNILFMFFPGSTVQHVLAPGSACKPITCCVVQFASLAQPWWREKRPKLSLSEHLVDLGRKSQ